jgi:hypothetical protein
MNNVCFVLESFNFIIEIIILSENLKNATVLPTDTFGQASKQVEL